MFYFLGLALILMMPNFSTLETADWWFLLPDLFCSLSGLFCFSWTRASCRDSISVVSNFKCVANAVTRWSKLVDKLPNNLGANCQKVPDSWSFICFNHVVVFLHLHSEILLLNIKFVRKILIFYSKWRQSACIDCIPCILHACSVSQPDTRYIKSSLMAKKIVNIANSFF